MMARDNIGNSERNCLASNVKVPIDMYEGEITDKTKLETKCPRVRFVDDENITERFVSTDEVDAALKVHILKNRSSSETSILLRTSSLTKQKCHDRPVSIDSAHLTTGDNLNNNTLRENLNGKISSILKPNFESERLKEDHAEGHKHDGNTKESEPNNFKKNCNVYSVNQAKTIFSERKKSLPLSNIPKLIGHRVNDTGLRSPTTADTEGANDNFAYNKDFTTRAIGKISRGIGKLLRRSNSVKISEPDPVYKVAYLGNVLTGWARGENCVEKPLATLWRNYNQSTKPDVVMKLSITNSGLKGATKEHGLTEYWSHRITYCASLPHYPKIFCWVYRHEGRKLKHELRCHAVLCSKETVAKKIAEELQLKLKQALAEFKKEKISRQNARLSLANSVYDNPTMPRRKILLSTGATNYRPPLERSKSAPKLGAIEELCSEEEEEAEVQNGNRGGCQNATENRSQINSRRWRLSDKIKSPRKHSLPESIGNEIFRKVEEDKIEDSSFSYEVFHLLGNKFQNSVIESNNLNSETSRIDNKNLEHPKKIDYLRTHLKKIDETSEMVESNSPYLVRDTKVLEMLGQSHLLQDSDDGSVSSGCETASTAASDIEPSSLPSHPHEDFCSKLVHREEDIKDEVSHDSMRFKREYSGCLTSSLSDFRSDSDDDRKGNSNLPISSESAVDLANYESGSECDRRPSEEVNSIPIGENNSFKRRSTYPPLKNLQGMYTSYNSHFETLLDNLTEFELLGSSGENEVFKNSGDNVSACSDESGYSELLDNGKESTIANTIMV